MGIPHSEKHLQCTEMAAMTVHGVMIRLLLAVMGIDSILLNMRMLAWSARCLRGGNSVRPTGVMRGPEPHIKAQLTRLGPA